MDGHLKGGYNWEGTRGRGVLVWRALKEMPFDTFLVIDDKIFWHLGGLEGITKKGQGEGWCEELWSFKFEGNAVWHISRDQKQRGAAVSSPQIGPMPVIFSSNWANHGAGRLEKCSFQDFGLCPTMKVVNSTNKSWHGSDLPVFPTSNVNWLKPLNKANVSPMMVIF